MGENRYYKMVSVLALVVGVIGVTLGYAAFSNTLTIESTAEVTPDASKFNVDFSSASNAVVTNAVTPTLSTSDDVNFTATNGTIDNTSDPTITNLHATFTEPGQTVTYTFYAYNAGEYIAYLNSINFDGTKTCTARTGTTADLVATACNGISLSVQVGSETAATATVDPINGHTLGIGAADQVTVVMTYAAGSGIADGAFDVEFPDIVLTYDSAD